MLKGTIKLHPVEKIIAGECKGLSRVTILGRFKWPRDDQRGDRVSSSAFVPLASNLR